MRLAGPVRQVHAIVTIIDRQDLRANSAQLRHVGRDPLRSRLQFTETLRLRELMWIASAFVFLDWYSTFLPTSRAVSPVPSS